VGGVAEPWDATGGTRGFHGTPVENHCRDSFVSGMHYYECVAPDVDIILQGGQF